WGVEGSRAWIDANADGKADYCRLISGNRLACTLSTGAGFGDTILSEGIDPGYPEARVWGDVDGDHRADYCRRGGDWATPRLQCSRSTGAGFVTDAPTAPLGAHLFPDTALADATGDRRDDYCRLTGTEPNVVVACTNLSGASPTPRAIVAGDAAGRAWV